MASRSNLEPGQLTLSLQPERRVYGVSELNAAIQQVLETEFRSIWVAGEISGCRLATSGHYYFCLKDQQSQLKCALFKGNARLVRFKPQDGLAVIVRGTLEAYEARSEYQLIVEFIQPQGAGALQLAFEQLKKKLAAEGLFESGRKRPLPKLPSRIGVITSPAGAVIRDMLHVLERRFEGLHIRVFPAQVQGEGSVEQICQGLRYFSANGWAEVVILARGGGSLEDLWSFNEEAVARAIVATRIPVISAIGHETDFTIADFVADMRAPTPSVAAEMVICTRESLLELIGACRARALQSIRYRLLVSSRDLHRRGIDRAHALVHRALTRRAQRVDDLESDLRRLPRHLLASHFKQLSDLNQRVGVSDLRLRCARNRRSLELLAEQLLKSMRTRVWNARRSQEGLEAHLTQLSPVAVLARGYAIVEDAQQHIVRSASDAKWGDALRVRLHRGELKVVVSETRPAN
ncbi:MAG: exodeoxyribonuclease VII large subunit [Acidobacteriaceae bacterium]|nr:exodeoxyribonuclease VII large subunit [Acidobacteriaceae bacterium]